MPLDFTLEDHTLPNGLRAHLIQNDSGYVAATLVLLLALPQFPTTDAGSIRVGAVQGNAVDVEHTVAHSAAETGKPGRDDDRAAIGQDVHGRTDVPAQQ